MIRDGTQLVSETSDTSMTVLQRAYGRPAYKAAIAEIWTFDSPARRAALCAELKRYGVKAVVRSALKPLLFAFLEEIDLTGSHQVTIRYPVLPDIPEARFRMEAYPVADYLEDRPLTLCAFTPADPSRPYFEVVLAGASGPPRQYRVEAPVHRTADHEGKSLLSPTGWQRIAAPDDPDLNCDKRFETDLEYAFAIVMETVQQTDWGPDPQSFHRLEISIAAPFHDLKLIAPDDHISTSEAMHEDLYFSVLEAFRLLQGLPPGDRTLAPGQIVPLLRCDDTAISVDVSTASHDPPAPLLKPDTISDLDNATHWLTAADIAAHLGDLGGAKINASSRLGRVVDARHIAGSGPGLFLSAGQHPNETTGPIGALRAAQKLAAAGQGNLVVAPLMNPDGFALFTQLATDFPTHMNHAARYTAGGCDLEYVDDGFEHRMYELAAERVNPLLHMNLHGYPAHEWTRPFTGYLPQGFADWMLPKGFFLILRHQPGYASLARDLMTGIAARLESNDDISALNRHQLARYERYAVNAPFQVQTGIPFIMVEQPTSPFPVTVITEAPDETVYGRVFQLWHEAQMLSVLAAYDVLVAHRSSA